ncbi:MAG: hypothetical protein WCG81_17780 [Candidatus Angelobacter sp.]
MGFLKNLFRSSKSDSATLVCGKCGTVVTTNAKRLQGEQRIAKKYGGSVREDGRVAVPGGISSATSPNALEEIATGAAQTEEIRRKLQRDLDENASRCGYRCVQCGKIFCFSCLVRDAETLPFFGGKACFACRGSLQTIDQPIHQAEYYIVSILAPEPDPAKRDVLIQGILALHGYVKGPPGVRFAVFASDPDSLESLTVGLMFTYEQESGMEIDTARTKIHSFRTDAIRGTMIAVFHTGKPCIRRAARQDDVARGRIQ